MIEHSRAEAAKAVKQAERTTDQESRKLYLRAAASWSQIADRAEQLERDLSWL
jgi:hypothetical protein